MTEWTIQGRPGQTGDRYRSVGSAVDRPSNESQAQPDELSDDKAA